MWYSGVWHSAGIPPKHPPPNAATLRIIVILHTLTAFSNDVEKEFKNLSPSPYTIAVIISLVIKLW